MMKRSSSVSKRSSMTNSHETNTPKPRKPDVPTPLKKVPKSEPHPKRKKLSQEIDEQLSDDEFDRLLEGMKSYNETKQMKIKEITGEDGSDLSNEEQGGGFESEEYDAFDSEDDSHDSDDEDDEDEDNDNVENDLNCSKEAESDEDSSDGDTDDEDDEDSEDEDVMQNVVKELRGTLKKEQNKMDNSAKQGQPKADRKTGTANLLKDVLKEREERTKKSLFLKGFPKSTTEQDVAVICRHPGKVTIQRGYAFVEFSSEELAHENFRKLQNGAIIGNRTVTVDYVNESADIEQGDFDLTTLYVSCASDIESRVVKLFPTSSSIEFPEPRGKTQFGFVKYEDAAECASAMTAAKDQDVADPPLTIQYAKKSRSFPKAEKRHKEAEQTHSASGKKKSKSSKKLQKTM